MRLKYIHTRKWWLGQLHSSRSISTGESHKSGRITICCIYNTNWNKLYTGWKIFEIFKTVGQDRAVLQGMRISRTKMSKIIKNVWSPYAKERHVKSLQNCEFSLHIDELTEPVQRKKWMTLQTRYVDEETTDVRGEPLSLLLLDTTNTTVGELFKEIQQYLTKFQIILGNILALSTNNAAVMIDNKNSFSTWLEKASFALKMNYPSHSCNLVAQHACKYSISKCFYEFFTWLIGYVRNSPKQEAEFNLFLEYLRDWYRIMLYPETKAHLFF